ncbi:MAG: hypothetical protein D5R99_04260 [Methanocalculus sp. MSAO_Arc1]|uniref:hypothetical protein n=1 Tax=Methanocalculus TaxID=71151 RepID=UPI000FF2D505|nr:MULTISPECIES: hypothetical protein [unclassified Methanocalculus]MCP1663224.1 hypothetical protein [Methanocalculus sp. AMF5]RQD80693.1 MAG: hypothetical protein D5R99_04260 [Methanocalculus sp. MSAO_Arc1]
MVSTDEIPKYSPEVVNSYIHAEDLDGIQQIIQDARHQKDQSSRLLLEAIANQLREAAFENGKPKYLVAGIEHHLPAAEDVAISCAAECIQTGDPEWLSAARRLLHAIPLKSRRSLCTSQIAERFINAGIRRRDAELIRQGITCIERIEFKKNRSASVNTLLPRITSYAVRTENPDLLNRACELLHFVHRTKPRSNLEIEIIRAHISIGTSTENYQLLEEAFLRAEEIPQKSMQYEAFSQIFSTLKALQRDQLIFDGGGYIKGRYESLSPESRRSFITAFTESLISFKREPEALRKDLAYLFDLAGTNRVDAINSILKCLISTPDKKTLQALLREIEDADIDLSENQVKKLLYLVALPGLRELHNHELLCIYRKVQENPLLFVQSAEFYVFIHLLIDAGYADWAYELVLDLLTAGEKKKPGVFQAAVDLLTHSLRSRTRSNAGCHLLFALADDQPYRDELILTAQHRCIQAVSSSDLETMVEKLIEIAMIHSKPDLALSNLILILIDSDIPVHLHISTLLTLNRQVQDPAIKDYSLSQIIVEITRNGVRHESRDTIQQAVAFGCMLEGTQARYDAFAQIINEVTAYATRDGDLDLLIRISTWCLELLSGDYRTRSLENIIGGLLRFGEQRDSSRAVSAAYDLAREVMDPGIRQELCESCIQAYISFGSARLGTGALLTDPNKLEWALEPFIHAQEIIRQSVPPKKLSHTIALAIDTILDLDQMQESMPLLIPLAFFLLEEPDHIKRKTILVRSSAQIRTLLNQIDLNSPYEMLASLIFEYQPAQRSPVVLGLVEKMIGEIPDPYTRAQKLASLTHAYRLLGDHTTAKEILDTIQLTVPQLHAGEAVDILTATAHCYYGIDTARAIECIHTAADFQCALSGYDADSAARKIIAATARYPEKADQALRIPDPYRMLESIEDPTEYVRAAIPLLATCDDELTHAGCIQKAYDTMLAIPAPYTRALLLTDFTAAQRDRMQEETKEACFNAAIEAAEEIKIPYIRFQLKKQIISLLVDDYTRSGRDRAGELILDLLHNITDPRIRLSIAGEFGLMALPGESSDQSLAPDSLVTQLLQQKIRLADDLDINQALQGISDKGILAQYYLGIAIANRRRAKSRRIEQLIQQAGREVSVIRPLSRRAYYQCDLALTCFAYGEYEHGGNFFDMAMDTATNISRADVRDEVFQELEIAMQLIQQMDEYQYISRAQ